MERKIKELERSVTERLSTAIDEGNEEKALELCQELARDFHNMYSMLHQAIGLFFLPYTQKLFEDSQGKLAEQIKKAVQGGDSGRAKRLLDKKRKQYRTIHDPYVEILGMLFGMIDEAFGDQALEDAHRNWGEQIKKWYDRRETMSAEDLLKYCTFMFNEHLSEKITVDEDGEKYTVILDGCGSGGRLLRHGLYEKSSGPLKRIGKAQVMTGGDTDFPVYCTHCQILFGALPMEKYGNPLWVIEAPKRTSDSCRILIYKDRSKIPDDYRRKWRR